MGDNKDKQGARDDSTISLDQQYEVSYAARDMKVAPRDIREAAEATGSNSRAVIYAWLVDNLRIDRSEEE